MNQKKQNVSMSVIRRLPRYYRFLSELGKNGATRISSKELSEKMGFTASQIRQDFNCFGGFLGKAIAGHMPFEQLGFSLIGVFDNAKRVIGGKISGNEILDYATVEEFYQEHHPVMAILCVPREYVEGVSDELYSLGIHSFWNFSHYDITMKHPDAIVENVHMNDSLMTLSYKLALAEAGDSGQAAG